MRILGWVFSFLISTPLFVVVGWLFYGGWGRFFEAMGTATAYRRRSLRGIRDMNDSADLRTSAKFGFLFTACLCVVIAVHWLGRAYWPR